MNINRLWKSFITAGIILVVTFSCQKEEDLAPQTEAQSLLNNGGLDGMMKLGKQLKNPYSVENMQKAWENLKKSNATGRIAGDEVEIRTTHLYIKFKPHSEEELDVLKNDSTLILYSYPLDYEIEEGGSFYHDPEVPIGLPTYQYASVKDGKNLPKIDYEIISELYIPEEDQQLNSESASERTSGDFFVNALVDEALRITDNLDEKTITNGKIQGRSSWRPAGRVQIYDNTHQSVMGVHGAKVRARRWYTTYVGYTDRNGNFSCNGTFKRDANYSIQWERQDYDIRSGTLGQAIYNGPKSSSSWFPTIWGGEQRMFAIVHQAAHDYYYGPRLGLKPPPTNAVHKTAVKISVYNKPNENSNGSHCADCKFLGIMSRLYVWNNGGDAQTIYGTSIHELAHASHWELGPYLWPPTEDRLKETWARGVQWGIGNIRYPGYRPPYFGEYTGLIEDLVDPANASGYDQVGGYTLLQIERVLGACLTYNDLEGELRNRYGNNTENNLPALFTFWR